MMARDFQTINEGVARCRETPGAVLVDVRTPEEYAQGHIPGSVNFPLERLRDYDGGEPVFAYCHSGARSARACALLEQMDVQAVNIGGIMDYAGELER